MKKRWVIGVVVVVILVLAAYLLIQSVDPADLLRQLHGM